MFHVKHLPHPWESIRFPRADPRCRTRLEHAILAARSVFYALSKHILAHLFRHGPRRRLRQRIE
jgi:hypothetical protein